MNNHLKNKNMQKDFSKGLQPALDQLPHGEVKQAAEDLKKILGITSAASFWYYRTGRKIPRADEAQKIMEYFKKWHINVYE